MLVFLREAKASDDFLIPLLGECGLSTSKKDLYLLAATCGDGCVTPPEECGETGLPPCPREQPCRDCRCGPGCGDGRLEAPEECDPPAPAGTCDLRYCGPDCRFHLRTPSCGDRCADAGEECGEPGLPDCRAGLACRDCRCGPGCGDGRLEAPEECDPPAPAGTCDLRYCGPDCRLRARTPRCGDRCTDSSLGETCDPPGSACATGGSCSASCLCPPACRIVVTDPADAPAGAPLEIEILGIELRSDSPSSSFDVSVELGAPPPAVVPPGLSHYDISAIITSEGGEYRACIHYEGLAEGAPLAAALTCVTPAGEMLSVPAAASVSGRRLHLAADPAGCTPGLLHGGWIEVRAAYQRGLEDGEDALPRTRLPGGC